MDKTWALKEELHKHINDKVLSKENLMLIQRWARFNGSELSYGDADTIAIDLGVWKLTEGSKSKKIKNTNVSVYREYFFDVTHIKDQAAGFEWVIMAEKIEKRKLHLPFDEPKLMAFLVDSRTNDPKNYPTVEQLKENLERHERRDYRNAIRFNYMGYGLVAFNSVSDSFNLFLQMLMNIESLDNEFPEEVKDVKQWELKLSNEERRKKELEFFKKLELLDKTKKDVQNKTD